MDAGVFGSWRPPLAPIPSRSGGGTPRSARRRTHNAARRKTRAVPSRIGAASGRSGGSAPRDGNVRRIKPSRPGPAVALSNGREAPHEASHHPVSHGKRPSARSAPPAPTVPKAPLRRGVAGGEAGGGPAEDQDLGLGHRQALRVPGARAPGSGAPFLRPG